MILLRIMQKHTRKVIPITSILINPENPRFEPVKNQNEAIELMLTEKESEIKKLTEDIIHNGLNPLKNIMVSPYEKRFLTLEGNRRVVCLKLLNDPKKTNNLDMREFFSQLNDKYFGDIPVNIPCVVFVNEDYANHWMLLEHTGKNDGAGVVPWGPEQKKRFLKKKTRDVLIFDFADKYNISRKDIDTTNLERLLSTSHVRDSIGISFKDEEIELQKSESTVKENIKKIFKDMSDKTFNVKKIYLKEDRERWIDGILKPENKPNSKNQTNATKTSDDAYDDSKKSTDRKNLIPKNCKLIINENRINDIFLELRNDLSLSGNKTTPNAVGVLFRVFLEVSIDEYINKKKIEFSSKPKLKEKINKVTEHMKKNNVATSTDLKYINQIGSAGNSHLLSIQHFHDYVHNKNIRPEGDDLKNKWDNLESFFKILWKNV